MIHCQMDLKTPSVTGKFSVLRHLIPVNLEYESNGTAFSFVRGRGGRSISEAFKLLCGLQLATA